MGKEWNRASEGKTAEMEQKREITKLEQLVHSPTPMEETARDRG